jgi:tubulin-folding cofactor B
MSLQSVADVPLIISSPNSSSERRISPSWTIAHLKSRLEPITGVPAGSQQLSLRVASQDAVPVTATNEEQTHLAVFPLQPYAEITVSVSLHLSLPSITGLVLRGLIHLASQ